MKHSLLFSLLFVFLIIACGSDRVESPIKQTVSEVKTDHSISAPQVVPDTLSYCLTEDNLGAGGYDLVNYFDQNTAMLGLENIKSTYNGVDYVFLTEANKSTFESSPEKYLPAYGGWCSMTLAMGNATVPKYDNFRVINGKLYLFERTLSVNGQTLWVQDTLANKHLAEKNYKDYTDDGIIELEE